MPLVLCVLIGVVVLVPVASYASSVSTGVLATGRYFHTATLLPDGTVFIAGGNDDHLGLDTFEIFDPMTNTSTLASETLVATRSYHTATLLPDGRVLLVGGTSSSGTCELFDYVTGESTASPATLNNPRYEHTATLLTDGRVLVAGGWGTGVGSVLETFEILDPSSGPGARWVLLSDTMTAASAAAPRRYHTATLLDDGRVLIVGGDTPTGLPPPDDWEPTASCGILDPSTGTWTEVGSLNTARKNHVAIKLHDGRVMVIGGIDASSNRLTSFEIFDPTSPGVWSTPTTPGPGEELEYQRNWFGAALLPDGRVLVAGDQEFIEVFDPADGTWGQWTTLPETLNTARIAPTVTLLADGRVLTTGGRMGGAISWFELIHVDDISVDTPTQALVDPRSRHTTTVLPDGRVLAIGGVDDTDPISPLSGCEVFDPGSDSWASDESLGTARYSHTATLLADGRILVVGGTTNGASALDSVEIYNPGPTPTFSGAASLTVARFNHTATLLADGRVMVTGGHNGSTYLDSVEVYDPGENSWTTITVDPLNLARELHTATLLADGTVLVVGGRNHTGWGGLHNTFEIFDPESGTWFMPAEVLHRARVRHTAILLTDGRVAAIGGRLIESQPQMTLDSFETFDPETGMWSMTAEALAAGRYLHTATLLPDGQILVVGGWGGYFPLNSIELLNPEIGTWTTLADTLNEARSWHTATVLADGRVLITGGEDYETPSVVSSTSEIINPVEGTYSARPEIQSVLSDADVRAVLDKTYTAPWCSEVGPACDSGMLLWSRGDMSLADNLDEPSSPNTLDGCNDGSLG
jgi:N-acetylneuraminic acid mutarotase